MSHCICGFNKAGEEIRYVDFSYRNSVASSLYDILDANEFNAGISGSGDSKFYSTQEMEKALENFTDTFKEDLVFEEGQQVYDWYWKQVHNFLLTCLETAQKEGQVRVAFC